MIITNRQLSIEDTQALSGLITSNTPTWTNKNSAYDIDSLAPRIGTEYEFFGAFDESDRLVMALGARRWSQQPVYTMLSLQTKATLGFSDFKHGFASLTEMLVTKMEAEGRLELWYLIEDKMIYRSRQTRNGRNILQYLVPALKDYVIFDVVRIPAGTLPDWPLYRSFLGNDVHPSDSVLRRAIHRRTIEAS